MVQGRKELGDVSLGARESPPALMGKAWAKEVGGQMASGAMRP